MGLLRFLLITITIFWLIKQIVRLLLPVIFQRIVNKVQNQASQRQQQNQASRQPEGQIRVEHMPPNHKEKKFGPERAGDFVDYEEIK